MRPNVPTDHADPRIRRDVDVLSAHFPWIDRRMLEAMVRRAHRDLPAYPLHTAA